MFKGGYSSHPKDFISRLNTWVSITVYLDPDNSELLFDEIERCGVQVLTDLKIRRSMLTAWQYTGPVKDKLNMRVSIATMSLEWGIGAILCESRSHCNVRHLALDAKRVSMNDREMRKQWQPRTSKMNFHMLKARAKAAETKGKYQN